MPLTELIEYKPNYILRNGHLHTFYPFLFYKRINLPYERERFETDDHDFLDVDFIRNANKKIAVLFHGLEGSSDSKYIRRLASVLLDNGWDIAALNYRGCSGEMNRRLPMYHSGATDDIDFLMGKVLEGYQEATLVGFSLGANKLLKYLGEKSNDLNSIIKSASAISVPLDLAQCSAYLSFPKSKKVYNEFFLRSLKDKLHKKKKDFPEEIDLSYLKKISNIWDFDNYYTGPIHGFLDAEDYYNKCSSINFIYDITIPTMILNSLDDPFLDPEMHPIDEFKSSEVLHLYLTKYGGHVGFVQGDLTLSESLVLEHVERFH